MYHTDKERSIEMATLIKHGTSPTGFGIRQRRNGALRPTSKCCGRSMEPALVGTKTRVVCKGCGLDYHGESWSLKASLGNDIILRNDADAARAVEQWVRKVTGYAEAELDVTW